MSLCHRPSPQGMKRFGAGRLPAERLNSPLGLVYSVTFPDDLAFDIQHPYLVMLWFRGHNALGRFFCQSFYCFTFIALLSWNHRKIISFGQLLPMT